MDHFIPSPTAGHMTRDQPQTFPLECISSVLTYLLMAWCKWLPQTSVHCTTLTTDQCPLYSSHYKPVYTVQLSLQASVHCTTLTTDQCTLYDSHYRPVYTVQLSLQTSVHCTTLTTDQCPLYSSHYTVLTSDCPLQTLLCTPHSEHITLWPVAVLPCK